jgi:6-phosphofructo-2-kinase/fructose-2,6-biphosphatase 2
LFLESKCDDPEVIATNIALKVQSGDPDYAGMSREEAEQDFRRRIDAYEKVYETVDEPDLSFCRIINVGERVTMNRIQGYLQSRIAFYLMNLHLKPRSIYLSRVSENDLVTRRELTNVAWREHVQCRRQDWRGFGFVAARLGLCEGIAGFDQEEYWGGTARGVDLDSAEDPANGIVFAV